MKKSPKIKIAMYWLAGCGGCEESILDLGEYLLDLIDKADILFWPIAADIKYDALKDMPDNHIDFSFINGTVRTLDHVKMARLLRRKSKTVTAHGSCAHLGGVPGLSGFYSSESLVKKAYEEAPSLADNKTTRDPAPDPQQLTERPYALSQIIDTDYYLPGCPTPPELIKSALLSFIAGELPQKGTVFGEKKALCSTCPLTDTRPDKIDLKKIRRVQTADYSPDRCFLDQGLICMGPVTRGGCFSQCIKANMPCRGCFGPLDNVSDYGAKAVSMLSSLIDENDIKKITSVIDQIPDPAGLFYRYSLTSSIIKKQGYRD